jgi:hypothetical protein
MSAMFNSFSQTKGSPKGRLQITFQNLCGNDYVNTTVTFLLAKQKMIIFKNITK